MVALGFGPTIAGSEMGACDEPRGLLDPGVLRLRVTDAALSRATGGPRVIYTDDLHLALAAGRRNMICVHLTHEREARGIV